MGEGLVPLAFWMVVKVAVVFLYPIGISIWQIRRIREGLQSKLKGIILFLAYSVIPIALYVLVFLVLIGAEELTDLAFISEGYARTFLIALGIWTAIVLLMTLIFALVAVLSKRREKITQPVAPADPRTGSGH